MALGDTYDIEINEENNGGWNKCYICQNCDTPRVILDEPYFGDGRKYLCAKKESNNVIVVFWPKKIIMGHVARKLKCPFSKTNSLIFEIFRNKKHLFRPHNRFFLVFSKKQFKFF
jgi:hypothetical protein